MDIRSNFGKIVNWDCLPKGNFNCYMFAVMNTIPTEVLEYVDIISGMPVLRSLIDEHTPYYFADIGQISGNTCYTNSNELIEALKCDFETLGLSVEECNSNTPVPEGHIKIAFYYNTHGLSRGKHSNFHFARQDGDKWFHKLGWIGSIKQLDYPIEEFLVYNLDLMGYFLLTLNHNRT